MSAIPAPNPNANDRAACLRKRRYSAAMAHLRTRELRERGTAVVRYECSNCGWWHLTKMGAA